MNKESLIKDLQDRDIQASLEQIDQLMDLMKTTLETNEKFNLTAIIDEETFLEKMIFDSALALKATDFTGKSLLDLGTGAGFPGMVMYILNPRINITLLDSTKKKIDYLQAYCLARGYKVNCVAARAEEYARKNKEKYDYVTARAVSDLSILMELSMPMLKVGGSLVALKAQSAQEEIKNAKNAFKKLDCHLVDLLEDELPESHDYRATVLIQKDKATNNKYPRGYSQIKDRKL